MLPKVLAIAALVVLSACSKPQEMVIPSDMSTWDKELGPVIQKLPEEDRKHFALFVARAKMAEAFNKDSGGIPFGTTVGQAIEQQKKWAAEMEAKVAEEKALREKKEKEEAELKAKLEAEKIATIKAINDVVTVTLVSKKELPADYQARRYSEYQQFNIGIQNNSDKTIAGVSGELEFVDLFDKTVGAVNFRITENIPSGSTHTWIGGRDYNRFLESHKAVWNLSLGEFKTRFNPEAVIFSDGSKLKMPE